MAETVFTHASWTEERGDSYERLEFLGDSVLELTVAAALYARHPDYPEGRLTKARAHVVSRATCAAVGAALGLGERLVARAPAGLEDDAKRLGATPSVVGAVLEAALGALFLAHGFAAIEGAIVDAFSEHIETAVSSRVDPKSDLQELLARSGRRVTYTELSDRRPGARPALHVRRRRGRRGARPRRGAHEEGRRAGSRSRGARKGRGDLLASRRMPDFTEFKQRAAVVWSAGAFEEVADSIADVHAALVDALAPQPGEEFLDVGCGAGNVAELAAQTGAHVTGIDLSPRLIDVARARAEAGGFHIHYSVGDAENLDVPDAELRRCLVVVRDDLRA